MAAANEAQDFARGLATVLETVAGVQPGSDGVEVEDYAMLDGGEIPGINLDAGEIDVQESRDFTRLFVTLRSGNLATITVTVTRPS